MSNTRMSGKEVALCSSKRVRTGTTIPLAPAILRGQTQCYGSKIVTSEGKRSYKSRTNAKYLSNIILDDVDLEREFPHIMHCRQELHIVFIL